MTDPIERLEEYLNVLDNSRGIQIHLDITVRLLRAVVEVMNKLNFVLDSGGDGMSLVWNEFDNFLTLIETELGKIE